MAKKTPSKLRTNPRTGERITIERMRKGGPGTGRIGPKETPAQRVSRPMVAKKLGMKSPEMVTSARKVVHKAGGIVKTAQVHAAARTENIPRELAGAQSRRALALANRVGKIKGITHAISFGAKVTKMKGLSLPSATLLAPSDIVRKHSGPMEPKALKSQRKRTGRKKPKA